MIKMQQNITNKMLLDFLLKVDKAFSVPLSHKQNLTFFADKLMEKGTICAKVRNNEILSLVAGYTDNVINNQAYISLVATISAMYGRGFAKKLVKDFVEANDKSLDFVHLYTVATDIAAVSMYRILGFVEYKAENETRPDDLHLILKL